MTPSFPDASLPSLVVNSAMAAMESESATTVEKIEMLLEMAAGLQKKPKDVEQLQSAVTLYEQALKLCDEEHPLLRARAMTGLGTALRTIPNDEAELLQEARSLYQSALPLLQEHGASEEAAEAEMNLGLVLQSLVGFGQAKMGEALQAYQRALRVFTADTYPQEYAILQNNIAIAYLSVSLTGEMDGFRQGMAVQTFEQALQAITLIDHPSEYAMLQNNLGNALQYAPSTHAVENNWRAVAAYDEALKVRNPRDTPLEYANTIANKANALANLPDDIDHPDAGNPKNLEQAKAYYREAQEIFASLQQWQQAESVLQALQELEA